MLWVNCSRTLTDVTIIRLSARMCSGPTYNGKRETVIGDLAPTVTSFDTDIGLEAPGAVASFKVYTLNATSNENGGKAVKIVRPED